MQSQLKLVNDRKNKIILSNHHMGEQSSSASEYEMLKQEGELIRNEIAMHMKRKTQL